MKRNYQNPQAQAWYRAAMLSPETFPIAFSYGKEHICGFPKERMTECSRSVLTDDKKETTTVVYRVDENLQVTLVASFYPAYGVSEWTVWFENVGSQNTDVIADLSSTLTFDGESPILEGIYGDIGRQYRPYSFSLAEAPVSFRSESGRPTHGNFPYFNLECGEGGVMLAIGWAGTWSADFSATGNAVTYTARSTLGLATYLKPGEKIRSALFVRAPYRSREAHYATNFWRSWFIHCNLPKADSAGALPKPFSTCNLASDTGLPNSDGSISERYYTWRPSLEKMIAEDVKVDFRWFDAGWYVAPDGHSEEERWWSTIGTWKLDPVKWPGKTFLESTDFARAHGMKTLMWFEPERVTDPKSLVQNHGYQMDWAIYRQGARVISNNIGNPDCFRWTVDRICGTLRDNKVEMYREDNNSDPGELWRYLDAIEGEDRVGITENKFIIAHYKMWDEIIACTLSYGGCGFVDSCASGGGRNDLESLRRGIPILRSDSDRTTTSLRLSMTTSFNRWIPFCGANTKEKASQLAPTGRSDVYTWRASYLPILNVDSQFVQDPDQDFGILRFGLKEWRKVSPCLLSDFYVLTPWHSEPEKDDFTAYSFYDPEAERGVLLVFRMEECEKSEIVLQLPYAEDGATYALVDEDSGECVTIIGAEARRDGVHFVLETPRSARLIWVEKR